MIPIRKEIRVVDRERGIVQVTVADGDRWYIREATDLETGLPSHQYVPSVTWITSYWPKGVGFMRWLAGKGFDEAEAIRATAGDKGSAVHQAIGELLAGKTVEMGASYVRPSTGAPAELTLDEYKALLDFRHFYDVTQPRTMFRERVIWSEQYHYAGTLDWLCWIETEKVEGIRGSAQGWWLIDFKTSSDVWPEHELQVSAYHQGVKEFRTANSAGIPPDVLQSLRLGLLQIGYRRNTRGWKFTEVQDHFELFLAVKQIWEKETARVEIFKAEYPLEISLDGATPPPPPTPKRRGRPRKAPAEHLAMGDA